MRSRAESFPDLCSRSRRSTPPPSSASADIRRSWSTRSALSDDSQVTFLSAKTASVGGTRLRSEDEHSEMSGEPHRPEEQKHAEKDLCGNRAGSRERRFDASDVKGGANQNDHSA